MAEADNAYVPVPIHNHLLDNSDLIDPEEERIQYLRDRKLQEEIEQRTKQRVQKIIDHNQNQPKNKILKQYIDKHSYVD